MSPPDRTSMLLLLQVLFTVTSCSRATTHSNSPQFPSDGVTIQYGLEATLGHLKTENVNTVQPNLTSNDGEPSFTTIANKENQYNSENSTSYPYQYNPTPSASYPYEYNPTPSASYPYQYNPTPSTYYYQYNPTPSTYYYQYNPTPSTYPYQYNSENITSGFDSNNYDSSTPHSRTNNLEASERKRDAKLETMFGKIDATSHLCSSSLPYWEDVYDRKVEDLKRKMDASVDTYSNELQERNITLSAKIDALTTIVRYVIEKSGKNLPSSIIRKLPIKL